MTGWESALYLEKGHLFVGEGLGAKCARGGEAVFNTGLTGYQEVFTDPSYYGQVVVMTYPHIGNTGVNALDPESGSVDCAGIVLREYCHEPSSWRSEQSLGAYLARIGVPGITDVDTREITKILRDEGAQRCILFATDDVKGKDLAAHGRSLLEGVPDMEGRELVSKVSCRAPYVYDGSEAGRAGTFVVYDFGVKMNSLRHLKERGFRVQVVPHDMPHQEVLGFKPVAVLLSNGPGDPATVVGAVEEIQALVAKVPIMAICMGHQLLARAMGATTYKLKFGHHGINHPVKDVVTGKILITSQNHGFAVRAEDLKAKDLTLSHVNLNDGTVEGFVSEKQRFYSVQFHPEAAPGPTDASYLFDNFIKGFLK